MADENSTKNITIADIATFLTTNPGSINNMLSANPNLSTLFLAAVGDHVQYDHKINSKVVDLIPALAAKARLDARKIKQENESLLHVATENMLGWTQLHHATLGLLASTDLPGMCLVIKNEFPKIFDLNHCQLIVEEEVAMGNVTDIGLNPYPAAQIDSATNNSNLYLGLPNDAAQKLLIKPVQSLAIIRLPDRLPDPISQVALVLGGKTANSFHPNLGSDLLVLIAEVVGVTLAARLELQDPKQ